MPYLACAIICYSLLIVELLIKWNGVAHSRHKDHTWFELMLPIQGSFIKQTTAKYFWILWVVSSICFANLQHILCPGVCCHTLYYILYCLLLLLMCFIQLLEYMIPPPPPAFPAAPWPKKTHVMVLAVGMVLASVMVLARVMVLAHIMVLARVLVLAHVMVLACDGWRRGSHDLSARRTK